MFIWFTSWIRATSFRLYIFIAGPGGFRIGSNLCFLQPPASWEFHWPGTAQLRRRYAVFQIGLTNERGVIEKHYKFEFASLKRLALMHTWHYRTGREAWSITRILPSQPYLRSDYSSKRLFSENDTNAVLTLHYTWNPAIKPRISSLLLACKSLLPPIKWPSKKKYIRICDDRTGSGTHWWILGERYAAPLSHGGSFELRCHCPFDRVWIIEWLCAPMQQIQTGILDRKDIPLWRQVLLGSTTVWTPGLRENNYIIISDSTLLCCTGSAVHTQIYSTTIRTSTKSLTGELIVWIGRQ